MNSVELKRARSHAEGSHDRSFGDQAGDQQHHDERTHEQIQFGQYAEDSAREG